MCNEGQIMSLEKQEEHSQASSFVQNKLDEQTSTSDLDTLRQQKPFWPVEHAYLKAFIKISRQKTKADHHHMVLNEALKKERPPRGLTPVIRHNIPKPPADLIISCVSYTNKLYSCWLLLVCVKAFYCFAHAVHGRRWRLGAMGVPYNG